MTGFTEIARGFYLEGLLVDGEDVWFTDVTEGGVQNLRTGQVVLPGRTMIGGLLMNADGSLLVAGLGGIDWVNPSNGAQGVLVSGIDGANEMRSDGVGGVLFGTIDLPAILAGKKPGPSTIRRMAKDGEMSVLCEGLAFANGLSLNPDGTALYFNDSFAAVRRFPISADFALGEMATMIDKYDCDGMALDVAGNVWICGFGSDHLLCLAPDGRELDRIVLPGPACTNLRFGGLDMRDLYVTVVDPAAAQRLAQGVPLTQKSSALYCGRAPVAGAPIARTEFALS